MGNFTRALYILLEILPLPMIAKGLLAAFKTEIASVIASGAAKLTGAGGQQDTTLQMKHTFLNTCTLTLTQ